MYCRGCWAPASFQTKSRVQNRGRDGRNCPVAVETSRTKRGRLGAMQNLAGHFAQSALLFGQALCFVGSVSESISLKTRETAELVRLQSNAYKAMTQTMCHVCSSEQKPHFLRIMDVDEAIFRSRKCNSAHSRPLHVITCTPTKERGCNNLHEWAKWRARVGKLRPLTTRDGPLRCSSPSLEKGHRSEKGHRRRNACVFLAYFNAVFRNLKALPITETLLKLIAAAAIMGLSSRSSEIG